GTEDGHLLMIPGVEASIALVERLEDADYGVVIASKWAREHVACAISAGLVYVLIETRVGICVRHLDDVAGARDLASDAARSWKPDFLDAGLADADAKETEKLLGNAVVDKDRGAFTIEDGRGGTDYLLDQGK